MAALATVSDYVTQARVLLQDTIAGPYRYSDDELVAALNIAMIEIRRIRPDIFIATTTTPSFVTPVDATAVSVDEQYRLAVLYFVCGYAQLRDAEDTQDARAGVFMQKFTSTLTAGA